MSELLKVTGLWASKDKNGNPVLKGSLGSARVLILKNTYKEKENHPDYDLYLVKREKKEEGAEKDSTETDTDLPF